MKIIITKTGRRHYYYEKGDEVISVSNDTSITVESVDVKGRRIVDNEGIMFDLTTDIRPTDETFKNAKVEDRREKVVSLNTNELFFAKTKPNAIIPSKRDEDAGYDVYTCETETIVIQPCSVRSIDTGVAIACNKKYFPKFFDKGGMGSLGLIIGAGVGDSGYRNNYFVPIINTNANKFFIMTNQSAEEIAECDYFDLNLNKFINSKLMTDEERQADGLFVEKIHCIIKPINKAFTQFVMIEVPKFETKEVSWEELQEIKSERGLGKLGSSGK